MKSSTKDDKHILRLRFTFVHLRSKMTNLLEIRRSASTPYNASRRPERQVALTTEKLGLTSLWVVTNRFMMILTVYRLFQGGALDSQVTDSQFINGLIGDGETALGRLCKTTNLSTPNRRSAPCVQRHTCQCGNRIWRFEFFSSDFSARQLAKSVHQKQVWVQLCHKRCCIHLSHRLVDIIISWHMFNRYHDRLPTKVPFKWSWARTNKR